MRSKARHLRARLFLNDYDVGAITVKGWDDAWGFGDFSPGADFGRYAERFGAWSRLMHDDGGDDRLAESAKDELRAVECDIDRIAAKLFLVDAQEWRQISQLNIDGPLVEWREDPAGNGVTSAA